MTNTSSTTLPDLPGGPLPSRDPGRTVRIAALYALAAYFVEHALEHAPQHVILTHHISPDDEIDAGLRAAAVRSFAERHGVEVHTAGSTLHASAVLEVDGLKVIFTLTTPMLNRERPL
jgi:hypothetical protein